MTEVEYRYALRLLDDALALFARHREPSAVHRRRLRGLSLEFALLRARLGQPAAHQRRN